MGAENMQNDEMVQNLASEFKSDNVDHFWAKKLSKTEKIHDIGKISLFSTVFGPKIGQILSDLHSEARLGILSSFCILLTPV